MTTQTVSVDLTLSELTLVSFLVSKEAMTSARAPQAGAISSLPSFARIAEARQALLDGLVGKLADVQGVDALIAGARS